MNTVPTPIPAPLPEAQEAPGFDPVAFIDFLIDERWIIVAVAAGATLIGAINAIWQTPIYESYTLIQIEGQSRSGLGEVLGEAGGFLEGSSSVAAEAEILRSRLVVGRAAADLNLHVRAAPQFAPYVGEWLARRATTLSEPGFLIWEGVVTGRESIEVALFEPPAFAIGQTYTLRATREGYELLSADGRSLARGVVGERLNWSQGGAAGRLLVRELTGQPGALFTVATAPMLAVTRGLQGGLAIEEQGRGSGILRVAFQDASPVRAAQVLNAIGAAAVRQNVERKSAEAEKSLLFLDSLLPQLRQRLEDSEQLYNRFRKQRGIFTLDAEASEFLSESAQRRVRLFDLEQQRRQLEARLQARHPAILTLDRQIASLRTEIDRFERRIDSLPDLEQDTLRLNREVLINQQLYSGLLNTVQQLQLAKEGRVGNVRIIDRAEPPDYAIKPQRGRILAIALSIGLIAGMGLAYLNRRLRQGVVAPEELEDRLGLNVFATVTLSVQQRELDERVEGRQAGVSLLAASQPNDGAIESLRSLRTTLQFAMQDAANNLVLLTGPTPGIGKSFVAANFAHVLAAGGKRVLLIDADLRKGRLHRVFGREAGRGFSELITGAVDLESALRREVAPNLDLLTTGVRPPNPAELLLSHSVATVLQALSHRYDIVLIDSPPVLAVSDTQSLGPLAGTVFMVARAEASTLGELQESLKRLRHVGAHVRGAIFNGLDLTRKRYGYGYGYGYRYGYRYYRYKDYRYGRQ